MTDPYEAGYADGESSHAADWDIALDGLLPDDVEPVPSQVAAYISKLIESSTQVITDSPGVVVPSTSIRNTEKYYGFKPGQKVGDAPCPVMVDGKHPVEHDGAECWHCGVTDKEV